MSCPSLELCINANVSIDEIAHFLGISLSHKHPYSIIGKYKFDARIGYIDLFDRTEVKYDYSPYSHSWKHVISFECGHSWQAIRDVLVIQLCEWLHPKFSGTYLGHYDTGDVLFYFDGKQLILSEKHSVSLPRLVFAGATIAPLLPC